MIKRTFIHFHKLYNFKYSKNQTNLILFHDRSNFPITIQKLTTVDHSKKESILLSVIFRNSYLKREEKNFKLIFLVGSMFKSGKIWVSEYSVKENFGFI